MQPGKIEVLKYKEPREVIHVEILQKGNSKHRTP